MTRSPETALLIDALKKVNRGEAVGLSVLAKTLGFTVTAANSYTARCAAAAEGFGSFEVKDGKIRRLTDEDTVERRLSLRHRKIGTQTRLGMREAVTVEYSALSPDLQRKHSVNVLRLGSTRAALAASDTEVTAMGRTFAKSEPIELTAVLRLAKDVKK